MFKRAYILTQGPNKEANPSLLLRKSLYDSCCFAWAAVTWVHISSLLFTIRPRRPTFHHRRPTFHHSGEPSSFIFSCKLYMFMYKYLASTFLFSQREIGEAGENHGGNTTRISRHRDNGVSIELVQPKILRRKSFELSFKFHFLVSCLFYFVNGNRLYIRFVILNIKFGCKLAQFVFLPWKCQVLFILIGINDLLMIWCYYVQFYILEVV